MLDSISHDLRLKQIVDRVDIRYKSLEDTSVKESLLDNMSRDMHRVFSNIDLNVFKRWFKTLKKEIAVKGSPTVLTGFKDVPTGLEIVVLDNGSLRVTLPNTPPFTLLCEDMGRIIKTYKPSEELPV